MRKINNHMKSKIFTLLFGLLIILVSCNSNSGDVSEKDLELQKKELDLKQRELALKETQLALDSVQNSKKRESTATKTKQTDVNEPKDGWSSYKSKKGGFQFQCPSDYVLERTYENNYPDISIINIYSSVDYRAIKKGKNTCGPSLISFNIYNNSDKLTALQWAKNNKEISNYSGSNKTVTVDNRNAISYSWSGMDEGYEILLSSDDLKYIYSFGVTYSDRNEKIRSDFLQIVKTIKF